MRTWAVAICVVVGLVGCDDHFTVNNRVTNNDNCVVTPVLGRNEVGPLLRPGESHEFAGDFEEDTKVELFALYGEADDQVPSALEGKVQVAQTPPSGSACPFVRGYAGCSAWTNLELHVVDSEDGKMDFTCN